MSASAAAERYARALFELGQENGKLGQIATDFKNFADALSEHHTLVRVLTDPVVGEEKRTALLRSVGTRLAMCTEALNAVRLLARRRRLSIVGEISRRLGTLADEKSGILRVTVTSAVALGQDYCQQLASKIEGATGKKVELSKAVDPSLIAGVVTQIGDRIIDGSLKGRLKKLEQQLLASA